MLFQLTLARDGRCCHCNFMSWDQAEMTAHLVASHLGGRRAKEAGGEGTVQCSLCPVVAADGGELEEHLHATHLPEVTLSTRLDVGRPAAPGGFSSGGGNDAGGGSDSGKDGKGGLGNGQGQQGHRGPQGPPFPLPLSMSMRDYGNHHGYGGGRTSTASCRSGSSAEDGSRVGGCGGAESEFGDAPSEYGDQRETVTSQASKLLKPRPEKTIQCPLCKTYCRETLLYAHLKVHKDLFYRGRSLECAHCPQVLTDVHAARNHTRWEHPGESFQMKSKYWCPLCNGSLFFGSVSDLREHLIGSHSAFGGYECGVCPEGAKFRTRHQWLHHAKYRHLQEIERNHQCQVCNFKAATANGLRKHNTRMHKCKSEVGHALPAPSAAGLPPSMGTAAAAAAAVAALGGVEDGGTPPAGGLPAVSSPLNHQQGLSFSPPHHHHHPAMAGAPPGVAETVAAVAAAAGFHLPQPHKAGSKMPLG